MNGSEPLCKRPHNIDVNGRSSSSGLQRDGWERCTVRMDHIFDPSDFMITVRYVRYGKHRLQLPLTLHAEPVRQNLTQAFQLADARLPSRQNFHIVATGGGLIRRYHSQDKE
jgi:hypothetical protein